jgi:putative sterol carrier protein
MDEASTVRMLFDRLASRGYAPMLHATTGTCQFDIEKVGRWYVTIEAGSISVSERPRHVDWWVSCSAADFIQIAQGKQNAVTAWLQGRVRVSGDIPTALAWTRIYPLTP